MAKIIEFFIRNRLFADMLGIVIVVMGLYSLLTIRRDAFPNVNFDIITVSTLYPGASAEEIEKLVTNPIEQDLSEVDGIKKVQSISVEGRSQIVVQLDPDQTTEAEGKEDVKTVVDRITFPKDAEDPLVTALETKQQPIIQVALSSSIPEIELREIAKKLERKLEAVPGVARVAYNGVRDLEIRVEVDPKKLIAKSVSLDEIVQALQAQNNSIPAGTLDPDPSASIKAEKIVRTIGEFETLTDVENTVVRANEMTQGIRVGELAKVSFQLEKRQVINKTNGVPSMSLTVIKKEKADAIHVVNNVRLAVEEFRAAGGNPEFSATFIDDISTFIRNRLSILSSNMVVGIILICITLSLFLPGRVALVVSAGIFVSFLGTMFFFQVNDYSLNLISLLGIIIVSGMLVDDAIVVTDNIVRYREMGLDSKEAAIRGTTEIWPAVTASVLTTIVAFLPMMFMSGIFGKFVKEIPLGVISALGFSLAESMFLLPQHFASFVRTIDFAKDPNPKGMAKIREKFLAYWEQTVIPKYLIAVRYVVERRYIAMGAMLGILVLAIGMSQIFLKFILFPPEGVEVFFLRTKSSPGITLEQAAEKIRPIEAIVGALPKEELESYVTSVGLVQQEPDDPNTKRGAEYSQIVVYLTPENRRDRTAEEIIDDLRSKVGKPADYEEVRFERVNPGPPVGKPISLGVQGATYEAILPAVAALKKEIEVIQGIRDISDSYTPGKPEIQIRPIGDLTASAGLSVAQVGNTVRAAVDGIVATSIQRLEDEVDVRVLFQEIGKTPTQVIDQIQIPNRIGNLVPLKGVAKIEEKQGISIYEHTNNQREVKVTADIDTDVNSSSAANEKIRKEILPNFSTKFPQVKVVFGGEDEDTQESMKSLVAAFTVAFLAIFLILIFTFGNLFQPFLVTLTIPMGIVGVLFALMLNGQPLSFMAMLGVIALAGVIVNNAIILVDFVNQERAKGMDKMESIFEAARTRLRPIFLTTMTTVAGLLPTAHGIGGLDKFVVPIAISLGYGLLFGSFLTAFIFPAAIATLDDFESFLKRKLQKGTKNS
jgi:multidrug efflux pump subunit AcrB